MNVLIVGGGIGGLSAALALRERGATPLVLEAGDRVGGWIHTEDLDGAIVEAGPQGFLEETPGTLDVIPALGLGGELLAASAAAQRRYVLKGDRLIALPASPLGLLATPLLSPRGRLRVLGEPWAKSAPREPETVHAFAARRIGREAADVLVDAMVTGIFAGDPRQLSLEACFPKMRKLEEEHGGLIRGMIARKKEARANGSASAGGPAGSKLHSLRGGMEQLPRALARTLGDHVRTGAAVESLRRQGSGWQVTLTSGETLEAPRLLLALPAPPAAALLDGESPAIAAALREIPHAAVAVVGLVFPREAVGHPLDGYGFLAPGGVRDLLGCLFESTVFPNRAPQGKVLLRAMVGGARRPQAVRRDEAEIISATTEELRPLLDLTGLPAAARCWRHERAIPQYDVGHPARLSRLDRELQNLPGLFLGGASQRGVSVNRLVADGPDLAARILA